MTQKEALIKLFKTEVGKHRNPMRMVGNSGHFIYGCLFYPLANDRDIGEVHKIGVSEESGCLHFEGIVEKLTAEELTELMTFYSNRIDYIDEQERIKMERKNRGNIALLEELASKNDFDLSRRVLFEKRAKKDSFKF